MVAWVYDIGSQPETRWDPIFSVCLRAMASRLYGPEESAAFQIVLKRRAHMLRTAFGSGQNIS